MKKFLTLGISMTLLIFLSSFLSINVNAEKASVKTIKKDVLKHKKAFNSIDLGYFYDLSGNLFHAFGDTATGDVADLQEWDVDHWQDLICSSAAYTASGSYYYIDGLIYAPLTGGFDSFTGTTGPMH